MFEGEHVVASAEGKSRLPPSPTL